MLDPLFVYGTLMSVARHPMGDLLRASGRSLGFGSIQARLYVIDDPDDPGKNYYPGAVPSANPADRVFGELHEVRDADVFAAFDRFEACAPGCTEPYEFLRRPVHVTLDSGAQIWARSYLYTWDVSGAQLIPSGRYSGAASEVR